MLFKKKKINIDILKITANYLIKSIPKFIIQINLIRDELTIVTLSEYLIPLITFLKKHINCQQNAVVDITAVDNPTKKHRFTLIYCLLSVKYNFRLKIKVYLNELSNSNSSNHIHSSTNWLEREIYDMYGIFFYKNVDLRRLLTDYGFQGYPLRKDFPLSGYIEIRYDQNKRKIVFEPLELAQEFRYYNFLKTWSNI